MSELFPVQPTNPRLSEQQVATVVQDEWGLAGSLQALGSMEDQNFRLTVADGARFVVKIAGRHTSVESLRLQDAALRHLAAADAGFATPCPVRTVSGDYTAEFDGYLVRVLTWMDGIPMAERSYVGPADLADLGVLAARVSAALDGFATDGLDTPNVWDVRHADAALTECIADLPQRWAAPLSAAIDTFRQLGDDLDFPRSVVHGDVTPVNAVCHADDTLGARPVGILDFGDVMRSWRIGDVAAAAVGALEHPGTDGALASALAVFSGYHSVAPFTEREIDCFWPLVIVRAAVTAAVSARQAAGNGANDYAAQAAASGERAMRRAASVPSAVAVAAVRAQCGLPAVPGAEVALSWLRVQQPAELVPGLAAATVVDLSVEADELGEGRWADRAALRTLLTDAPVTVARWGEATVLGQSGPTPEAPATLRLGAAVFAAEGTPVATPLPAVVESAAGGVLLRLAARSASLALRLTGVRADQTVVGTAVLAGAKIGAVDGGQGLLPAHVHAQLVLAEEMPEYGVVADRRGWLAVNPDPSTVLGIDVAAPPPTEPALRQRDRGRVVAAPQHLYFDRPPALVRGWRHHLYDTDGRCYLDMINNIAAVGHSHQRITAAATRQLRRLNTNSRFLYDSMTRYAERILELLPPSLDRVLFVNSGSEAADLALQLAQRATGRRDVVALAGAYHGWTGSVIAVSSSPMDRPHWREEIEPWVHVAAQPDTYRGGADVEAFRRSVRDALAAAQAHGGAAAFVCEPLLGNQGGLELPAGYLRGVYEDVRTAGGLCVADEVQVGMGRTGSTFWAFEHEGVVPDIVYTAKSTGNGYPLGVVACTAEVADLFDSSTSYFSSTGGGPVSCEVGIAVLDVLRDEQLQLNAVRMGRRLRSGLGDLATRHELIGAVHGRGLYQGVDLVLDRESRAPAVYEARAISERLRARGVVMSPTGDAYNVLKVKPPMCLDAVAVDYFIEALDAVLTDLT